MPHFTRAATDAEWNGPLDPTWLRHIDEQTGAAINGDEGGTWTPSALIEIGGAGVAVLGPCTMPGASVIVTSAGKHIVHGRLDADDYITFAAPLPSRSLSALITPSGNGFAHAALDSSRNLPFAATARQHLARFNAKIRVHHGATLAAVDLTWLVGGTRAAVPEFRPRFRIVRVDLDGKVEPLRVASDTSPEGFLTLGSTVSAAAYVAGNAAQVVTYTCNQVDRLTVDVARFDYLVEIIEEGGDDAWTAPQTIGNVFWCTRTTNTNIKHLGPQ